MALQELISQIFYKMSIKIFNILVYLQLLSWSTWGWRASSKKGIFFFSFQFRGFNDMVPTSACLNTDGMTMHKRRKEHAAVLETKETGECSGLFFYNNLLAWTTSEILQSYFNPFQMKHQQWPFGHTLQRSCHIPRLPLWGPWLNMSSPRGQMTSKP